MQIVIDIPEDVLKRTVFYREFRDLNDYVTTIRAFEKAIKALEQQPCDDCISRQAVLNMIGNVPDHDDGMVFEALSHAQRDVALLPSVTPKQTKWIPVSERLPEDRREVLVTAYWHETYQVMMASYFGDGVWWCVPFNNCGEHLLKLNPKAWMTLPEPYKAESEDRE